MPKFGSFSRFPKHVAVVFDIRCPFICPPLPTVSHCCELYTPSLVCMYSSKYIYKHGTSFGYTYLNRAMLMCASTEIWKHHGFRMVPNKMWKKSSDGFSFHQLGYQKNPNLKWMMPGGTPISGNLGNLHTGKTTFKENNQKHTHHFYGISQ